MTTLHVTRPPPGWLARPAGWWQVHHPGRRDTVLARTATPDQAAAVAAQEWSIAPGAYTVTTDTQEIAP